MLEFFQSSIGTPCRALPNDYFRDMQQAKIDEQWDDTSARYTVMEQKSIGSEIFEEIEVWIDYVVGQTSGGLKYNLAPLYSNIQCYLLKCWKALRDLMLKRKDEICLNGNALKSLNIG